MVMFDVQNEYDQLRHVILGTGLGMKPEADPKLQAGLPKTSFIYSQPDPVVTEREFTDVLKAMQKLNIKVERPNLVDSPQITDQTCPGYWFCDRLVVLQGSKSFRLTQ